MKEIVGWESLAILLIPAGLAAYFGYYELTAIAICLIVGCVAIDQVFRPDTFGGLVVSIALTIVLFALAIASAQHVTGVTVLEAIR